jgi:hypothetical protein
VNPLADGVGGVGRRGVQGSEDYDLGSGRQVVVRAATRR